MKRDLMDEKDDIFSALAALEMEKGISQEVIIEALEGALASAYKKVADGSTGNVEVRLNPEKRTCRFYLNYTVFPIYPKLILFLFFSYNSILKLLFLRGYFPVKVSAACD